MATIESFRKIIPGSDKMSDAEIVGHVASTLKVPAIEIADRLGFDDRSGLTGNEFKAAGNNYTGGLYGLGEAIAKSTGLTGAEDWARKHREENELKANIALQRAAAQGAVQDWEHVHSPSDLGSFVKHLGIQSAPYMAEAITGGLGARAAMSGTRAALEAARASGNAVEAAQAAKALGRGQLAGSVAASYPSSVADILGNQREQNGQTNLGAAAALGVPYAALNALGIEGAVGGRGLMRSGIQAIDDLSGIKGGLARMAVAGGKSGAEEAFGETGQEMINQLGRMAVDPTAQMFSPEALGRYKESAIGGGLLGSAFGAGMGGWRRNSPPSNLLNPNQDQTPADDQNKPLLGLNPNVPLQSWINQQTGVTKPLNQNALKSRQADIMAAMNEPSGQFVSDENGIERELTMGEVATRGSVPPDVKTEINEYVQKAADLAGLPLTNKKGAIVPQRVDALTRTLKLFGTDLLTQDQFNETVEQLKKNRYSTVHKTLDQIEADAAAKAQEATALALAQQPRRVKKETDVGVPTTLTETIDPSVPTGSPDTAGGVAASGSDAIVGGTNSSNAVLPNANSGEVSLLSGGASQPVTPVVRRKRVVNVAALQPANAYVADTSVQDNVPTQAAEPVVAQQANPELSSEDQLEIARATGNAGEAEAAQQESISNYAATSQEDHEKEIQSVLAKRFEKSKNPARDIDVANAYIKALKDAPHGSKYLVQALIGRQYGIGIKTVQKIGNAQELKRAAQSMGISQAAVENLFEVNTETAPSESDAQQVQNVLAAQGVTAGENDNLGFEVDDKKNAWKLGSVKEGRGDTENAIIETYANAVQNVYEAEDKIRAMADEYVAEGNEAYANELYALADKQASKLTDALEKYQTALKDKEAKAKAAKAEAEAKAKEKTKTKKVKAEEEVEENHQEKTDVTPTLDKDLKFGKDTRAKNPYTVKQLIEEIKNFIRADVVGRKLVIVDSVADLLNSPYEHEQELGAALAIEGAYGVTKDGKAYLIANRIEQGTGRSKFMHEVGAHLGLENLLPTVTYNKLIKQLNDWVNSDADTDEVTLAARAKLRVENAETPAKDQDAELLAYFIEEAVQGGIDPTASGKESGPLMTWFRTLWAAFKTAVRKLGFKPESMTAQDIVDLAFGAARLEMAGTFHGTAATFRKFNHKFMGSGEGAQAYGWGTYLAQRAGIARGYWKADVQRKTSPVEVLYKGKNIDDIATELFFKDGSLTKDEKALLDIVTQISLQAGVGNPNAVRSAHLDLAKKLNKTAEEKYASEWLDKHYSEFTSKSTSPVGSLLRVDVGVEEKDLLDWDQPLSKQPNVLKAIKDNLSSDVISTLEEEYNDDLDNLTGEDFYRGLQALEKRDGLISDQFKDIEDYNKRLASKGSKQIVSTYLDEIAKVPGIRFWDAMSRGSAPEKQLVFNGATYNSDELRNLVKDARNGTGSLTLDEVTNLRHVLHVGVSAAVEEYKQKIQRTINNSVQIFKESSERFKVPYDEKDAIARAHALADKTYEAQQLKWLESNLKNIKVVSKQKTRTKNLVVFNDKNIQVIGNAVGANKQNMRFGKSASAVASNSILNSPQVAVVQESLKAKLSTAINYIAFTSDLLKKAFSQDLYEARTLMGLYQQRSALTNKLEVQARKVIDLADAIDPKELPVAAKVIQDMTRLGKWSFQPTWLKTQIAVDPAMRARLTSLSKESKAWIEATFKHGYDMLQQKKNFVMDAANLEYDALISAAQADNDLKRVASLQAAKAAKVKEYSRLFRVNENLPYAPLKRYGDFVVVAKSKEYQDAEKANDTKKKAQLENDENHYYVDFVEDNANALKLIRELQATNKFSDVYGREKEAVRDSLYGGTLGALNKLKTTLAAELENAHSPAEKAALKKTQDMVMDMFLTSLAENSARKSELGRKGIAGNIDMLRSFATQARADAHFLSASKHNTEVNLAFNKMRKQLKALPSSKQLEASKTFNEILKRHGDSMEFNQNNWTVGLINRATSLWMLATSPIYYLQNLTQPFMLSLPVMTERHNYIKTANALAKAYSEVGALFKENKADGSLDFNGFSADVRKMLETLSDRGRIQISMDAELGRVRLDSTGKASQAWNKIDRMIRSASEKIEAINRITTAMAAYRMELAKTGDMAKAIDYADSIIERTHGDYTSINASRAFNNNLGKVALQFRKFQLIQATLLIKLVYNSAKGESAEVRAGARKALAFTLGHTAVMAGAVGLPGFALLSFLLSNLAKLWQEPEDEPFDLEQSLRKMIGDEDIANLILRGAPNLAGVDLSAKLGMGNVFSIIPYSDVELSRKGFNEVATGLVLGASGAVGAKVFDGLGQIAKGEYYRGLETLMPTGIANGMKAYREQEGGVTKRNGDLTMPAEEITALDTFATAIGLTTTKKSLQTQRSEQKYQTEQHFKEQADRVRNDFLTAKKNGESTEEPREAWKRLQDKRVEAGFKRQGVDALLKAAQQQRIREKGVIEGIPYNKRNKQYVEELTNV